MKSSTMTNIFLIGIFVMMAYLVFSNRDVTINSNAQIDNTIAVEGSAETFAKPDTASVSFSVTKKASTTDVAMNSVNERMAILVTQLQAVGVEEKDIKTTSYNVYPEYSYNKGKQIFEGYRVTQSITVVIRDLKNTSNVLATVNSAGVDNVSQLTFYVDDMDKINAQLRSDAIADAKEQAKQIAKDLGVSLGDVVGYDDYNNEADLYPAMEKAYAMADAAPVAEAVVPTGENQFSTNVTVIYQIQ
jgi:uncharacterized protein YggE